MSHPDGNLDWPSAGSGDSLLGPEGMDHTSGTRDDSFTHQALLVPSASRKVRQSRDRVAQKTIRSPQRDMEHRHDREMRSCLAVFIKATGNVTAGRRAST